MIGKHLIDVFGGSSFLTKATNHLGLCAQMIQLAHSAVVDSACAGLVLDAGSHEVRSSDVCSVGDTR